MVKTIARWALYLTLVMVGAQPVYAQDPAVVAVEPAEVQVQPGQEFELNLVAYGVTDLYQVEIDVVFEPGYLEVIDQDPVLVGAQVAIDSSFLKPDFLMQNDADNSLGILSVAYNQVPPSDAVSGDGVLFRIRMRALSEGTVAVKLGGAVMARSDSSRMSVASRSAEVRIGGDLVAEPTSTETIVPTATATLTPVPTDAPVIPTDTPVPEPTATPTFVPTGTPIPEPEVATVEPSSTAADFEASAGTPTATADGSTFESPVTAPTDSGGESTFQSPVKTLTVSPTPTAGSTPGSTVTPTAEAGPTASPTPARIDPAAEPVQPSGYQSLAFIAVVVGIIIIGYALFVVLPRGRKGRA